MMLDRSIVTPRLLIRPLCIADAMAVHGYRSDPEVFKFQGYCPSNIDNTRDFIRNNTAQFNVEGHWYQLAICCGTQLVGDIGVHFLGPENSQCEIGYTVSREHQGIGIGQEAVAAVIDHLFVKMAKHRITASSDPRNEASVRLLEKVGFRKEGYFVKSYLHNGEWVDDALYALLREEWDFLRSDIVNFIQAR